MNLNRPIGGYFELETHDFGTIFHDDAVAVNSARNAFEVIIRHLDLKHIHLPFYTCDVTLQPLKRLGIDYSFYYLDRQFYPKLHISNPHETILYVNYFGICDHNVKLLSKQFENLIVDNSQAFFTKHLDNTHSFYSPRKFFGVSDGGFAHTGNDKTDNFEVDKSYQRLSHLLTRIDESSEYGYRAFKANEAKLDNAPIKKMSKLTTKLLRGVLYDEVIIARNENFRYLHQYLDQNNELSSILDKIFINGPMVYPYLHEGNSELRTVLINNNVFVAKYWPNVVEWVNDKSAFEIYLYNNLIPLPIDQRYDQREMKVILDIIIGSAI